MDVFVSRLRKYLIKDPKISIKNVYGSGFILEIEELIGVKWEVAEKYEERLKKNWSCMHSPELGYLVILPINSIC